MLLGRRIGLRSGVCGLRATGRLFCRTGGLITSYSPCFLVACRAHALPMYFRIGDVDLGVRGRSDSTGLISNRGFPFRSVVRAPSVISTRFRGSGSGGDGASDRDGDGVFVGLRPDGLTSRLVSTAVGDESTTVDDCSSEDGGPCADHSLSGLCSALLALPPEIGSISIAGDSPVVPSDRMETL